MATGINIKTYFNGAWHDGNTPVINAADHGAWQAQISKPTSTALGTTATHQ